MESEKVHLVTGVVLPSQAVADDEFLLFFLP